MKLFLCGGGCGEQTAAVLRVFNAHIDHEKPLLYIPLAMPEEQHTLDECYEWVKGELSEVDIPSIEMVRSYEELAAKNLSDYGAIFIGGGNTFELLKGMKDSGAFAKMEEYIKNDGVVMGGSAGAIIFGKDIMPAIAMDPNDVALEDTAGFNVLDDCSIFAHYTNEWNPEAHVRFTKFMEKYSSENEAVYALPEEDTIFINGDQVQVIGDRPYYFFENGTREKKMAELRNELTDNEWPLEYIDHDVRQNMTERMETERLILRPIRQEDTDEIYNCWMHDPDVSRYMMWTAGDMNTAREFVEFELGNIEKDDWYRWIITDKNTVIIGTCLLYFDEEFDAWDISYNLGKKYWGHGYITEAMKKVIEYAFRTIKAKEIVAFHAVENPASGRVIEKLGFTYEKEIPFECNIGETKARFYRIKNPDM